MAASEKDLRAFAHEASRLVGSIELPADSPTPGGGFQTRVDAHLRSHASVSKEQKELALRSALSSVIREINDYLGE